MLLQLKSASASFFVRKVAMWSFIFFVRKVAMWPFIFCVRESAFAKWWLDFPPRLEELYGDDRLGSTMVVWRRTVQLWFVIFNVLVLIFYIRTPEEELALQIFHRQGATWMCLGLSCLALRAPIIIRFQLLQWHCITTSSACLILITFHTSHL